MPNDDLRQRIDALEAREAIRDLVARYCHYVRERRHDDIVALYAPDGVFDMPANMAEGGVRAGPEAIAETFARHNEALDPWPFTHNHVIDLSGETTATGHVYTEFRLGRDAMRVRFVGVYDDHYVRHDGVWKFQSRKLQSVEIPA